MTWGKAQWNTWETLTHTFSLPRSASWQDTYRTSIHHPVNYRQVESLDPSFPRLSCQVCLLYWFNIHCIYLTRTYFRTSTLICVHFKVQLYFKNVFFVRRKRFRNGNSVFTLETLRNHGGDANKNVTWTKIPPHFLDHFATISIPSNCIIWPLTIRELNS